MLGRARALTLRLQKVARTRPESGQVLVLTALSMVLMVAMGAFVINVAQLQLARHRAQVAADAGALSAAQEMETTSASTTAVTTEGTTIASADDPSGSSTISLPEGATGNEAAATVTQKLPTPLSGVFGLSTGSVSATAVAQWSTTVTKVVQDGNITADGCSTYCEYYYACPTGTCPTGSYPPTQTIGDGPWKVTAAAETPDTTSNDGESSVDLQNCNGDVTGTTCADIPDTSGSSADPEVVDLNGDSEGGMWQTVSTVAGTAYVLSFELTGNPAGYNSDEYQVTPATTCYQAFPAFTGNVYVTNGSNTQYVPGNSSYDTATVLADTTFTHTNSPSDQATWSTSPVTVSFTATSSSTTITFNSTTYDNNKWPCYQYGPEVTNVVLSYPGDALVQ